MPWRFLLLTALSFLISAAVAQVPSGDAAGLRMAPPKASSADTPFLRQFEEQGKALNPTQVEGVRAGAPALPPSNAADAEFLRQLEAQQETLREKGPNAITPKPPAATAAKVVKPGTVATGTPATPKAAPPSKTRPAAPEPAPTIDADLAAIAAMESDYVPGVEDEEKLVTKTVVFISLSMPDTTLKHYFQQAKGRDDVLFVLRGWKPPNFTVVGQKLKQLLYDAEAFETNVVIDPYPFRTYKVKQVPVFLHQRPSGDWRRITGEISLDRATDEIDRGNYNRVLGATYKIAEPDIVEEIQKIGAKFDWDKERAKMIGQVQTNMDGTRPLVELPRVEVTRDFYVDPSIEVVEDVVGVDGVVAVKKGAKLNPFSTMSFSKSFIAFDPDDPKQVAVAKRWQQEFTPVMLLATHLPTPSTNAPTLAQTMGQSVYPLSPELVERMGIAAVPSLIRQQGMLLRITEEKP